MYNYDTVTEALAGLKSRGYELDFNIAFDKLECSKEQLQLNPDDFEITEVYRFEGNTDPGDEEVVYAVQSKDGKSKGVVTSAYGMYATEISTELLQKLKLHHD
jgi:hypothetical protein